MSAKYFNAGKLSGVLAILGFAFLLHGNVFAQSLTITNVSVSPNPASVGDTVTFTAEVVILDAEGDDVEDEDGLVLDLDFGDGSAHATTLSTTHVYSVAGSFDIEFEATLGNLNDDLDVSIEIVGPGNDVANTTTVGFKESYKVGVKGFKDFGEVDFEEVASGKTTVTAEISLEQMDLSSVNGDTTFSFAVGENFLTSGKLSDDAKFKSGATKAKIVTKEDVGFNKEKIVTVETVSLKWDAGKNLLKVKITAKTPDFVDTILSEDFVDEGIFGEFTMPLFCEMQFGSARGVVLIDGSVEISGKTVTKGKGDNADEFETFKVTSSGSATFSQ